MTTSRGAASIELVLVTPALVALMLLVVFVGRVAQARADVDRAARDAARVASVSRSRDEAIADGTAAARASLRDAAVACETLRVDVDATDFGPGGSVRATVTCALTLDDLSLLRVPGARTLTATFAQPVDVFRGLDG